MNKEQRKVLKKVMADNRKWPIVAVGATADDVEKEGVLVIEDLKQDIITLLKDRRQKGKKLSDDMQIVIPVASLDLVPKEIQKFVLIWVVK